MSDLSSRLDGRGSLEVRTRALNDLAHAKMAWTRDYFRRYSLTYDECEELVGKTWEALSLFILSGRYRDCGKDPIKLVSVFAKHVRLNYFARDRRQNYQLVSLDLYEEDESLTDHEMLSDAEGWLDLKDRLDAEFPDPDDQRIIFLVLQGYTHAADMVTQLQLSERTIWRRMTHIRPKLYPILKETDMAMQDDK